MATFTKIMGNIDEAIENQERSLNYDKKEAMKKGKPSACTNWRSCTT